MSPAPRDEGREPGPEGQPPPTEGPGSRPRRPGGEGGKRIAKEGESDSIRRPDESVPSGSSGFAGILRQAAPFLGAAWVMTAALLLGAFAGRWLDDRLGTEPLLLVLGLLLGTVLGLWEIARVALLQTSDGAGGGRDDER